MQMNFCLQRAIFIFLQGQIKPKSSLNVLGDEHTVKRDFSSGFDFMHLALNS